MLDCSIASKHSASMAHSHYTLARDRVAVCQALATHLHCWSLRKAPEAWILIAELHLAVCIRHVTHLGLLFLRSWSVRGAGGGPLLGFAPGH